jgi:transketolase
MTDPAGQAALASASWAERHAGSARDVARRRLLELARDDPRIVCLDSDMGGLEEGFGAELPERYVNVGIAEANMMTMAAAMAASGKVPFVNTMAGFASARACEQVKIDVAYNAQPVKILATHGGLSAGHYGPTHQALEDVAIMRAFPNMTVIVPADAAEAAKAVEAAVDLAGPVYIRLGRAATPLVHQDDYRFEVGRAEVLRDGHDVAILAAGPHPVLLALEAHDRLAQAGVSAAVLNVHTVKPLDESGVLSVARRARGLVTVEDHSVIGGLGGAVAELVSSRHPTRVVRIGMPDTFSHHVGPHRYLLDQYGITTEAIVDAALGIGRRRLG